MCVNEGTDHCCGRAVPGKGSVLGKGSQQLSVWVLATAEFTTSNSSSCRAAKWHYTTSLACYLCFSPVSSSFNFLGPHNCSSFPTWFWFVFSHSLAVRFLSCYEQDAAKLLLHCYLCPYLGHGHGPLWPGQGHLPPRLRLLLVSSWPKRKQPDQKQGIKRMPKTRVHSTLCKVPARSQPTLTTQELQLYSWSRELMIHLSISIRAPVQSMQTGGYLLLVPLRDWSCCWPYACPRPEMCVRACACACMCACVLFGQQQGERRTSTHKITYKQTHRHTVKIQTHTHAHTHTRPHQFLKLVSTRSRPLHVWNEQQRLINTEKTKSFDHSKTFV